MENNIEYLPEDDSGKSWKIVYSDDGTVERWFSYDGINWIRWYPGDPR